MFGDTSDNGLTDPPGLAIVDIGKMVLAIAQDLLPFSTGEIINVDGGIHIQRL